MPTKFRRILAREAKVYDVIRWHGRLFRVLSTWPAVGIVHVAPVKMRNSDTRGWYAIRGDTPVKLKLKGKL